MCTNFYHHAKTPKIIDASRFHCSGCSCSFGLGILRFSRIPQKTKCEICRRIRLRTFRICISLAQSGFKIPPSDSTVVPTTHCSARKNFHCQEVSALWFGCISFFLSLLITVILCANKIQCWRCIYAVSESRKEWEPPPASFPRLAVRVGSSVKQQQKHHLKSFSMPPKEASPCRTGRKGHREGGGSSRDPEEGRGGQLSSGTRAEQASFIFSVALA